MRNWIRLGIFTLLLHIGVSPAFAQQSEPVQIANWIMVNHWGTLISNRPIRLEPRPDGRNAYRDIDPENDWNYEGTLATVKEYMEKNPPAVHKQKDHEPAR